MTLDHLKPEVPKHWLIAIAGLVWSTAGGILLMAAWQWLQPLPLDRIIGLVTGGLCLAVLLYRAMLARIAQRNMSRICNYAERGCLFAFQAWRSYLIILVMIAMGAFLRHTSISREILALLYTAMAGALIYASLAYFILFWRIRFWNAPCPSDLDG